MTGEIFDEFWLERDGLPPADARLAALRCQPDRPDVSTFCQRVPDAIPRHPKLYRAATNYAVLPLTNYEQDANGNFCHGKYPQLTASTPYVHSGQAMIFKALVTLISVRQTALAAVV